MRTPTDTEVAIAKSYLALSKAQAAIDKAQGAINGKQHQLQPQWVRRQNKRQQGQPLLDG